MRGDNIVGVSRRQLFSECIYVSVHVCLGTWVLGFENDGVYTCASTLGYFHKAKSFV